MANISKETTFSRNFATTVCRFGQREKCCAFLAIDEAGFECIKMEPLADVIRQRLAEGTLKALGEGGWSNCIWENLQIPETEPVKKSTKKKKSAKTKNRE